ncbi:MAG TPA: YaaR family protein [Bacillota bacterium]|nr:YaaR family protein [Bacillota bacterium]
MKITKEMHSQAVRQVRTATHDKQTFEKLVQSQRSSIKEQEMQHLLKEITEQGEKLARFHSFRDLARYKRLVKGFLEKAVDQGLDLDKSYHFSFDDQAKPMSIVKKVDEKLVELTEEVMDQEKKSIHLLDIVGEIKGLLINLYT